MQYRHTKRLYTDDKYTDEGFVVGPVDPEDKGPAASTGGKGRGKRGPDALVAAGPVASTGGKGAGTGGGASGKKRRTLRGGGALPAEPGDFVCVIGHLSATF